MEPLDLFDFARPTNQMEPLDLFDFARPSSLARDRAVLRFIRAIPSVTLFPCFFFNIMRDRRIFTIKNWMDSIFLNLIRLGDGGQGARARDFACGN